MARKIFVSYKYNDAKDYANRLAELLAKDNIYKGESEGEDLSDKSDEYIENHLSEKMFDSSVTIVLISKNMQDITKTERNQWIPWEISYSLREKNRGGITSGANAMIAVVVPDENNNYEYFVKTICSRGCTGWENDKLFKILGKNMFNRKQPKTIPCPNHSAGSVVHIDNDHSYIHPVKWENFVSNIEFYLNLASEINKNIEAYEIKKQIDCS